MFIALCRSMAGNCESARAIFRGIGAVERSKIVSRNCRKCRNSFWSSKGASPSIRDAYLSSKLARRLLAVSRRPHVTQGGSSDVQRRRPELS